MPPSATPTSSCAFCNKPGLPILPVRYAIARAGEMSANANAPDLPPTFGEGVTDIALPSDTAKYALRTLRPGYLYVYDEHRREWSGYVVNSQGYLWQFDIHAKTPPEVGEKTFNLACRGKSDPYLARCIAVKSAPRATKVWLGFSDVAWTPAVLARHDSDDYRQTSMQCIDVAAWRDGKPQAHVTGFDALTQVAEFAANGAALQQGTRDYLKHFFPGGFEHPEDITGYHPKAKTALSMLSPLFQKLLVHTSGTVWESGPFVTAAWAFASQPIHIARAETDAMQAWGRQAAQPYRPAIVGLADPAGIAMDLNGLAIQRSVEFTDDKTRKWKYETAQLIAGIKQAIGHGAVESEAADRRFSVELGSAWQTSKIGYLSRQDFDAQQARVKQAGTLSATDEEKAANHAWGKYAQYIKTDDWENYLLGTKDKKSGYQKDLDDFAEGHLVPLDESYVAWLKSQAFQRYLTQNFDTQDPRSGEAYLDLVRLVITESSGRSAVFKLLSQLLEQDPREPDAWLMRALALNHEPLIQAWSQAALAQATASGKSWAELAETFHDHYKDIVGDIIEHMPGDSPGTRFADKAARLIYQISGPLTLKISQAVDKGLAHVMPTCWQMGVLGTVARAGNPDLIMVDLRGMWSREDAARTLAGMLTRLAGGKAGLYRSQARLALDKLATADNALHPYHGVMLIDRTKAKALANMRNARQGESIDGLLTAEPFDEIMQESIGKLFNFDVKSGVVQLVLSSVTLTRAYHEMVKAKPDEASEKMADFAGGLTSVVGGAAAVVGKGFENTTVGAARLAKQYQFFAIKVETRADWFTGTGKLFGAVGGLIGGVLIFLDGLALLDNHPVLGWTSIFLGGASTLISGALVFAEVAAGVLNIISLVIAIIFFVVAYLKPNAVQDWLEKTIYFGAGEKKFESPVEQLLALRALQQGGGQ